MTKIKICGLRTGEEAIAARDMGADFLGFIFVSGARRCLEAVYAKSEIAKLKESPPKPHDCRLYVRCYQVSLRTNKFGSNHFARSKAR